MAGTKQDTPTCFNCGASLIYHPPTSTSSQDYFWTCPGCGLETWPSPENPEKEIRKMFKAGKGKR